MQGLSQVLKRGLNQDIIQGLSQMLKQELNQAIMQGLSQVLKQGLNQAITQGLSQVLSYARAVLRAYERTQSSILYIQCLVRRVCKG